MTRNSTRKLDAFENHVTKYMNTVFKSGTALLKLLEECSEVIKAISKYYCHEGPFDEIVVEMTHVLISFRTLMKLYNVSFDDIMREVERKDNLI